jgi:predicted AAA+ superfamily ATPase
MAVTNHERVGKALELLKAGLAPYVEREFAHVYKDDAVVEAARYIHDDRHQSDGQIADWDVAALLRLMWEAWNDVFRNALGPAERSLVNELRGFRNQWAHQKRFSSDDSYRALDSASRLLTAVSASEAVEVESIKMELLRLRFDEQMRSERRRSTATTIESQVTGALPPWREIVNPHADVSGGHYQQAEFAADLWQVHLDEGSDEYRDPVEFYRRTYLTESLGQLLRSATERLTGNGGDPVVQLQTNFGGGKTHSMLALYHLFSGADATKLQGVDSVLDNVSDVPEARRVVLVGNRISPGNPAVKADGTVIHTLWGEIAWQLGHSAGGVKEAKKAYRRVQADDEKATNPGDALRELFNKYSPCLILIDEWVAYARQLHDQGRLSGGNFETQFSFAQALTESAKLADRCLLLISLPASDTTDSPHTQADDAEVGGQRGREALERLRNVVGRVESSWRPASAEEGFEIVRRRLFQPLVEQEHFVARDTVARGFYDLYKSQKQEFPSECGEIDYEKRLRAAYPIHPEVFDRLYGDWSTLVKFQRTRGVLRLMAAVIHSLWEKGDRNPLIMPCNIPIDDTRVQFELTRYLSDNWTPIIEKDVDGPSSLPQQIDSEIQNLGKHSACRRVARTIYMGSAPTATASNRGIEEGRIRLGCVMPGESTAVFGDALRRLTSAATYLYPDGARYWYSTQPTVTKLAEDRAEELARNPDAVAADLDRRLRVDLNDSGDFSRIHPWPASGGDIPDDLDARLVVMDIDHPHTRDDESPALEMAQQILESRGNAPRLYRNSLVFLAVDRSRLQDLDSAVRHYLAWQSIVDESDTINLTAQQKKQSEAQRDSADGTVKARIPEAYQWLLAPIQETPQAEVTWQEFRLQGQDGLADRAAKKLRREELLLPAIAPSRLRMELDRVPLWRGNHVEIRQLVDDFGRYLYLPRLCDSKVLLESVRDGFALTSWDLDSFAYADSLDSTNGRYRGLRCAVQVPIADEDASGLLVRPDIAKPQLDDERGGIEPDGGDDGSGEDDPRIDPPDDPKVQKPRRFHGSIALDPVRTGSDAGRVAEEVIAHLAGLENADVTVTLEISVDVPGGASEQTVRIVNENCRTLKFESHGFETE